jgi:hypothetical protein
MEGLRPGPKGVGWDRIGCKGSDGRGVPTLPSQDPMEIIVRF